MNMLIMPDGNILAAGQYQDTPSAWIFSDVVVPKTVASGAVFVNVQNVPSDFTHRDYTYTNGQLVKNGTIPTTVEYYTNNQIVHAMEGLGIASVVLNLVDPITLAKFYTAKNPIPETEPILVNALQATGKTMEEFKAQIAKDLLTP